MKIMKKIIIIRLVIARNCFQNDKNAKIRILFDVRIF